MGIERHYPSGGFTMRKLTARIQDLEIKISRSKDELQLLLSQYSDSLQDELEKIEGFIYTDDNQPFSLNQLSQRTKIQRISSNVNFKIKKLRSYLELVEREDLQEVRDMIRELNGKGVKTVLTWEDLK